MLIDMRLNGRSSLFTDKDSLHVVSIYYHIEYGQFIDLSGSEWLAPLAVAATTVVVTTLSVVLLTVSTLAVSPQVTTTLNGVVVPDVALGAVALLPLEPSVRALAAANHGVTPSGVGRDDYLAKWSVSILMILSETLASAITKADIYISILEEYVKGF